MSDVKPDSAGAKLSAMPGLVSTEPPFSAAHTTGQSAAAAAVLGCAWAWCTLCYFAQTTCCCQETPQSSSQKLCQCGKRAWSIAFLPAPMHHFKQSMLLLQGQLAQDACQQRKGNRSCSGHVLCPAEAVMRSLNLGALPGAAEQKPGTQDQQESKCMCMHKPMHLVRYSSVSCVMPVLPTTVLGMKGPVLWTTHIQADITMGRSLNRDIVFKCNQMPLNTGASSCN
jgi:hypothetical protein